MNTAVESRLLAGGDLEESLAEHIGLPGMELLAALETFMCRRSVQPVRDHIRNAVAAIENSVPGRGLINRMAKEMAVSPKTFIASFADTVGLTPVQYLHLSKVNCALESISRNTNASLTELALQLGFYDQAHFIRVFKGLCRISPCAYRQYLARRSAIPGAAPNSILLSDTPRDRALFQPFLPH